MLKKISIIILIFIPFISYKVSATTFYTETLKEKNINAERRNKNVPCRAGWYMNDMVLCENKTAWIYVDLVVEKKENNV